MFSQFLKLFSFEKFSKRSLKNHILAKILVFWARSAKIFKNKKLIKKVKKTLSRYIYIAWQIFAEFCPKLFFTLVKDIFENG